MKKNQFEQFEKEKEDLKLILNSYSKFIDFNNNEIFENLNVFKENINDENKVNIIIKKLKEIYLNNNNNILTETKEKIESNKKKISEINEILEQIKEDKNKNKEIENYQNEIKKLSNEFFKGFILINFPENKSQAHYLEFLISNYKLPTENKKTINEILQEKILFFYDKEIKKNSNIINESNCINKIFVFECNKENVIERENNRKIDPINNVIYHMIFNPPNLKDKNLMQRLIDVENSLKIDEIYENFSFDWEDLREFYNNFKMNVEFINTNNEKNENENNNFENEINNNVDKINESLKNLILEFENKICPNNNNNIENTNSQNTQTNKEINNDEINKTESIKTPKPSKFINFNQNYKIIKCFKFKTPSNQLNQIYLNLNDFLLKYSYYYKKIFNKLKNNSNDIGENLENFQKNFIEFLSKPSKKYFYLKKFTDKYLAFNRKFDYMNMNKLVIDDFKKDINDLNEILWKEIMKKKRRRNY